MAGSERQSHAALRRQRVSDGKWTLAELKAMVQCKITERTAQATVEKQDAFKLFGRPVAGITPTHFKKQLRKWGIKLTLDEVLLFLDYLGIESECCLGAPCGSMPILYC